MQRATGLAVTAIKHISSTVAENSHVATAIAAAIKQQDAATRQIARNVHQAAEGTNQASLNIRGLAKVSTDNGIAAGQVLDQARGLSQQATQLRGAVDDFLHAVKGI